ncbi:MAG: hypothetical protein P4L83_03625 [Nevskia sp.]|nr:hypothetical protein [Nevskia sp.]
MAEQEFRLVDLRSGVTSFLLAAQRPQLAQRPGPRFWQGFAESYLAALCHILGRVR